MTEFKQGYLVDYNGQLASVLRVNDNTCVIQLSDHRKAVRKELLKIVKADESSDIRSYRVEMEKEKELAKEASTLETTQKVCTRCNELKPIEEFSRARGNHYRAKCKKCIGELISEGHKAKQKTKTEEVKIVEEPKVKLEEWVENNQSKEVVEEPKEEMRFNEVSAELAKNIEYFANIELIASAVVKTMKLFESYLKGDVSVDE